MQKRACLQHETTTAPDPAAFRDGAALGLYRPDAEHDACGVGFVADSGGRPSHRVLEMALEALRRMDHRGGAGADAEAADGSGVLAQIPHGLLAADRDLPEAGTYGVGMLFLPREVARRERGVALVERCVAAEGHVVLGWREVPVDPSHCGPSTEPARPHVVQVFVGAAADVPLDDLERHLYVLRKQIEAAAGEEGLGADTDDGLYVCSLSARTVVYKGMLQPGQLPRFYPDLADPRFATAVAVVHSRFSTNTFPSWQRAHPYRLMAHNGEINTLRGNRAWMTAREGSLVSPLLTEAQLQRARPVLDPSGSDSAMFDNALELLVRGGRTMAHAVMMMMPEAWEQHDDLPAARRDFYRWHASMQEPWDGPACVTFTDGRMVGGALDRNGLRPARWAVTHDGLVILASEVGVVDLEPERVARKGRLGPGDLLVVDLQRGEILEGTDAKERVVARKPWGDWLQRHQRRLRDLPCPVAADPVPVDALDRLQRQFGYTREDLRLLLGPMAIAGKEPIGSMGRDTPPAVLSERPQLLFRYFTQLFAQVTNPPIDPIRESLVMSLRTTLGPRGDLLTEEPDSCDQLVLDSPVLRTDDLARLRQLDEAVILPTRFDPEGGGAALEAAVDALCAAAEARVRGGAQLLILSDRDSERATAPIPSLLAVSAVHHHLVRAGLRTRCSLIADTGEAREVMHLCLLVGFGAEAVHPWLAYRTLAGLCADDPELAEAGTDPATAADRYVAALDKGLLKVLSKMGISTLQSYHGAQVFEAVGLKREVVDRWFPGTPARLDGVGVDGIAWEVREWHLHAWEDDALQTGGAYAYRRDGEHHLYDPATIGLLQHACRSGRYGVFRRFAERCDTHGSRKGTFRGQLRLRRGAPIPLDEVEPVARIARRFKTGAMSLGSLSREAHENLAVAMNRIGGRSNTGEGGEDPVRFGDERRSAIKQVASGRFGVTIDYLVHADEIQIKMAQGAKPGEGGQLPGHKVDDYIAGLRHATPGVGLISPPPHHDIYSIEDLAQLIHDLKCANPGARVTVKLVAEAGVGTVAAGVAKAKADTILISGASGGTGAAPLSSVQHAGVPWELGLAEAHQTLVLDGLRGRVRLETDGQLKTGRDVVVAALLGAEEFGFGTAALVASGCVLMRACHLNTCPVGIATQDPELRARFAGEPQHVVNFMTFVARHVREIMAELGVRTVDELVGRTDLLEAVPLDHPKARDLDLSPLLYQPPVDGPRRCVRDQDHGLEDHLDRRILAEVGEAPFAGGPAEVELPICNTDRAVGTLLSHEVTRRGGLPDGAIRVRLEGSAGQSLGAFLARGISLDVVGEANDYVGKGLSGGRITLRPPPHTGFDPDRAVILGNTALYGATGGTLFARGRAGERFAVRNSGAVAVVEGVGDHGCEYMTGGTVVVLGPTGRNFAAGMSGGIAYVFDEDDTFAERCNRAMVRLGPVPADELRALHQLLRRHHASTDSAVAWRILSGWQTMARRFVRVMPRDYERVLAEREVVGLAGG